MRSAGRAALAAGRRRPESAAVLALELSVDSPIAVATAGLEASLQQVAWLDPCSASRLGTVQDLAKLAELPPLPPGHNLAGVGAAVAGW